MSILSLTRACFHEIDFAVCDVKKPFQYADEKLGISLKVLTKH
jgi:hypothetical protein